MENIHPLIVAIILTLLPPAGCLNNGLARTPPRGWLAWERFRCNIDCQTEPDNCISEKLFKDMADNMVQLGLAEAGYVYVNIDDCWSSMERNETTGRLQPDPQRFPNGIAALADYVHAKGLKLGIYGDFGTETCAGYPGSLFNLALDAETFADWGVDMVKLDGCNSCVDIQPAGYAQMERFLNRTKRPMLFSCSWPAYHNGYINYTLAASSCNMWRNYIDVQDSFASVRQIAEFYALNRYGFLDVAAPGQWNDPDMLIVGDFGLSPTEEKLQISLWITLAAPLFISTDLRSIRADSLSLLLNRNLLRIADDVSGLSGFRLAADWPAKAMDVWFRPLSSGSFVLLLLNWNTDGIPRRGLAHVGHLLPRTVFNETAKDSMVFQVREVLHDKVLVERFELYRMGKGVNSTVPFVVDPNGSFFVRFDVVNEADFFGWPRRVFRLNRP